MLTLGGEHPQIAIVGIDDLLLGCFYCYRSGFWSGCFYQEIPIKVCKQR